jgi:hypothetical protein
MRRVRLTSAAKILAALVDYVSPIGGERYPHRSMVEPFSLR